MKAFIDADVLIWHLRGEARASAFLRRMGAEERYELWTGALQRAEIVFFMRPDEEESTHLLLSRFKTAPVTQRTVDSAAALYRKWHPSHGVDINDAMLAATVMDAGGQLFCLNIRHYPMPDIVVTRAW